MSAEKSDAAVSDLEKLIKSLRDTILELRGVLDELSNPVVPVQLPTEGGRRLVKQGGLEAPTREGEGSAAAGGEGAEGTRLPENSGEGETVSRPGEGPLSGSKSGLRQHTGAPVAVSERIGRAEQLSGAELGLEKLAGLLRLVYDLESRVPSDYLMGLVDILHGSGLIDEAQRDTVKKIIELARIGIEHGLSVDESIAILAALSKELGLDVTEITEELVKAIMQRRGSERWESRQ